MASIGSFGVDSSILVRCGSHNRHLIPVSAFRPRKCVKIRCSFDCNSVGVSRIWADDIFNGSSRCNIWGRLKMEHVKAMAEGKGGSDSSDESDDSLQATIEKSKKVLAMQRDLLEQIAERKELVSSIKNSLLDPEGSKQHFMEKNGTISKPDAAKSEASAPSKHVPDSTKLGKPEKETYLDRNPKVPLKAAGLGDVQSKKGPSALPWKSYVIPSQDPSSNKNSFEELKSTITSGSATSQKVNSMKNLKDTTLKAAIIPDKQPPSTEDGKYKDLKESSSEDAVDENEKAPPLAGLNVMNVILVSAECAPFSKTGGLGDVAGALPKALARRGHRVMVVAPRYGEYAEAKDSGVRKRYKVDGQDHEVNYFQAYIDGVDFVFIDSPMFRHIEKNIYGGNRVDILKRMVLFCKAAIEVPWYVPCGGVCYGDGNLAFIANDWHTALIPVYLKAYYQDNGLMKYTRSVLVIHNIAHQGRGPMDDFPIVDLPLRYSDLVKFYDPVGGEHLNIFAAGLKSADRVVTVSHGYSWELKTPEGGWGLHNVINENNWKLCGIVNGIDADDWSPELDVHLSSDGYANYSIETLKAGKPQCKAALQKELGLPVNENIPLIGFIGRLDNQKGVDLIAEAVPWMMGQNVQLVMLGTGREDLEQLLRQFEIQYNDKVRGWVGFSVRTAHRITAGVDILLMPSRFEPCGLNQLYAMRYGTIPVVHAVGGLRDTVQQFNPYEDSGLGWTFSRAEANELIHALGNCLWTYREFKNSWEGLQRRGMEQDLSWDIAAQNYEEVLVAAKFQW